MNQSLDDDHWFSIRFGEIDLPSSLMGISILVSDNSLSESTGDWIWRIVHCRDVPKIGSASWCCESATELIDHLVKNRDHVMTQIHERLSNHGFDPANTFQEWISGLTSIKEVSAVKSAECSWIAASPKFDPQKTDTTTKRFLGALDRYRDELGIK